MGRSVPRARVLSVMAIWTKPPARRTLRVLEWGDIGGSRLTRLLRLEEESVLGYDEAIPRRSVHENIDQHP
jgi:hypothetical protein